MSGGADLDRRPLPWQGSILPLNYRRNSINSLNDTAIVGKILADYDIILPVKHIPIILVSGGSCSGKSVFAHLFQNAFILEMDHFYYGKPLMKKRPDGTYDFDAPEAVDIEYCARAAKELITGKKVTIPKYNMNISERIGTQQIQLPKAAKFLVIEGIFAFYPPLLPIADLKIYIDVPTEIRVARRMLRDQQKGRSDIETLAWSITVEKNHQKYVEPTKKHADIIIPFSYNPIQMKV